MKKLPIGIQTFEKIINGDYLYIDKTKYIYELVTGGTVYFLSRPRRFGKSLLISTLADIFTGNKELFKGLYIYNTDWKWEAGPVIRIDYSKQKAESPEELKKFIFDQLDNIAKNYKVELKRTEYYARFEELILELKDHGKVAILIDEYDKPIIDHITDIPLAKEMREIMKGFYTILKGMDEHIRFLLLTGVSKFSKAGVFSGLNQLDDLSMDTRYSAILGITGDELESYFSDRIDDFVRDENITKKELLDKIGTWYNGYCFSHKCKRVYNPFSTLSFFEKKSFKNYWFETGTPSFLINLIKEKQYDIISIPVQVNEMAFSTYELEYLEITPLLFQTGYLTIKDFNASRMLYTLDFPNHEVKNSFLSYLLDKFSGNAIASSNIFQLIDALKIPDFEMFFNILKSFFASIPYDLHLNYEKYYQTIFYSIFHLMGIEIKAEIKTNTGRVDAIVEDKFILIFEFKFNGAKEEALAQIKEKKYYEPFLNKGKDIYLTGVVFEDKNIGDWVVEKMG